MSSNNHSNKSNNDTPAADEFWCFSLSGVVVLFLAIFAVLAFGRIIASPDSSATSITDPASIARGKILYNNCVACHGAKGEGNELYLAPTLVNQQAWYISSAYEKFKNAVRGAHADDIAGLRMLPMGRILKSDQDIADVAAYLETLSTGTKPPTTLADADPSQGAAQYPMCLACHGPDGKGNDMLKAPSIAYLNDWYIVAQLEKFKSGIRGTHPDDLTGAQMRPMTLALNTQQMKDLAAHIVQLKPKVAE